MSDVAETVQVPSLEETVERVLSEQAGRVLFFSWSGADFVIKRVERKARGRLKQAILTLLCRVVFPGYVLAGGLRPGDGWFEARRIGALGEAGMRVPRVVMERPDAVVYTHCGTNLSLYLAALPQALRSSVIMHAVDDLADFHKAGLWHGGSQFRNILVAPSNDGGSPIPGTEMLYRIDFEEDLEGRFSTPLLQVYDLSLFLVDALSHGPNSEQATDFGMALLRRYRRVYWSPAHQQLIRRVARMMKPVIWLEPFFSWRRHPESERTLALAKLLVLASTDVNGGC